MSGSVFPVRAPRHCPGDDGRAKRELCFQEALGRLRVTVDSDQPCSFRWFARFMASPQHHNATTARPTAEVHHSIASLSTPGGRPFQ